MARFNVIFHKIYVANDGDGATFAGKGEIYFEFRVDQDKVAERTRDNHISVNDKETIQLSKNYLVDRPDDSMFVVTGYVAEADGKLTGDDDFAGDFTHSYSGPLWNGIPGYKEVHLKGNGVDVTVHYEIQKA